METPVIPVLWKLSKDFKFENNLTYKVKQCLNKAFAEPFLFLIASDFLTVLIVTAKENKVRLFSG